MQEKVKGRRFYSYSHGDQLNQPHRISGVTDFTDKSPSYPVTVHKTLMDYLGPPETTFFPKGK